MEIKKQIERLAISIQTLKSIFNDLELNVKANIEYKDNTKEEINVYEVIENQIVKDINYYNSHVSIENLKCGNAMFIRNKDSKEGKWVLFDYSDNDYIHCYWLENEVLCDDFLKISDYIFLFCGEED
jgi:hypothetical protein